MAPAQEHVLEMVWFALISEVAMKLETVENPGTAGPEDGCDVITANVDASKSFPPMRTG